MFLVWAQYVFSVVLMCVIGSLCSGFTNVSGFIDAMLSVLFPGIAFISSSLGSPSANSFLFDFVVFFGFYRLSCVCR